MTWEEISRELFEKKTAKRLNIEEYLAPPSVRADWVSGFLKSYVMILKGTNEEELEEIFDMVRFDWKTFNGDMNDCERTMESS